MARTPQIHYKQNRLKQLRAFCQAAQFGSISEAADRLYLSQPTVSLQIQALERELETVLFERRGPKIRLTPEGDTLYKLAQPLVEGMDKLQETFAAACGKLESGELDIAAGESTILYLLPEPMRLFAERYPEIRLKLHNVTGRDGMALLRADQVDFAIGSLLDVPEDVSYQPVVNFGPVLITPLDHPLAGRESVTLHDISPFGLILPPQHLSTWRMVDLVFKQHDAGYKVTLEAGGWEVIKKYVEIGLGISIVTDLCLTGRERIARIPLGEYFTDRSYGIVLRRGKFLSPQAKRFLELVREVYGSGAEQAGVQ